jgi:PTH1 family peptidyl-tRNA hydrolase
MLFVGLGNPGAQYEHTRHNAGTWFIESLAKRANVSLRNTTRFHGLHAAARLDDHECHFLIPTTFMNLSGQAVQALATYYKIPPQQILIAHDEIDLPTGSIKLKFDGGHGGHNGLRDIIRHLNTNQFHRLRIGVGHPGTSAEVHNYVLSPPKKAEREQIDQALEKAEDLLSLILKGQYQKAMLELHS